MDASWWNGPPEDDDPLGEHQDEENCPDCGAGPEEPCSPECGCRFCRAKEIAERERTKTHVAAGR